MFFLNTFRGKLFHNTLHSYFILLFPKELLGTKNVQIASSSCSIIMYIMIVHKGTMKYRWHEMIIKQTFEHHDK